MDEIEKLLQESAQVAKGLKKQDEPAPAPEPYVFFSIVCLRLLKPCC